MRLLSSADHQRTTAQYGTAQHSTAGFANHLAGLQEVDRSGMGEAAAPRVLQRHFTAALQRVPPSVSARDRRLYDAMRSQVIQHLGLRLEFCTCRS